MRVGEEDIRGYGVGQEEKLPMDYAPRRIPLPAEYENTRSLRWRHTTSTPTIM